MEERGILKIVGEVDGATQKLRRGQLMEFTFVGDEKENARETTPMMLEESVLDLIIILTAWDLKCRWAREEERTKRKARSTQDECEKDGTLKKPKTMTDNAQDLCIVSWNMNKSSGQYDIVTDMTQVQVLVVCIRRLEIGRKMVLMKKLAGESFEQRMRRRRPSQ